MQEAAAPLNAKFPEAFVGLFRPSRYKVFYGGRGSAKSWNFARALLLVGAGKKLRVLCVREIQNSIAESVHKLLKDQIELLGLQNIYSVQQNVIWSAKTGTTFHFEGIKANTDKIKSYEGIDVCWVEEAHNVSKNSWDVLIPTIRTPGSEIWVSFNPELTEQETYKRFITNRPPNALVRKVTWRDNPWFPQELRDEMEYCRQTNYDDYLWIWEGNTKIVLDGAVYMKEIRAALLEGRVGAVPIERGFPVDVIMDLGRADNTAAWFKQQVAFQHRFVDFLQDNRQDMDYYIQAIKARGYNLGTVWLPHDAKALKLGQKLSVERQMKEGLRGVAKVRILPKWKVLDGLAAARAIFPNCWFDETKCALGWRALTEYKYELIPGTTVFNTKKPLHNEWSDAADSFRYCGMAYKMPRGTEQDDVDEEGEGGALDVRRGALGKIGKMFGTISGQGWMR